MGQYGQVLSTARYVTSQDTLADNAEHTKPTTASSRKPLFSLKDFYSSAGHLTSLALASLTVFFQPLAIYLGQLNQLIVVGFLLAIMALILQGQVLRSLMIFHGKRSSTTLQNIDATLRQDILAPQASLWLRAVLLALTALPLGLSASYKLFVGGSSNKMLHLQDGLFGYTATPGNQRIGDGLTLLADSYRPFWIDPALNRSYGFNLYIEDNSTAVIVDTPYPSYLTSLRSHLSNSESLTLTTLVNATVSRQTPITATQRISTTYWDDVFLLFGHDATTNGGNTNGANNALLAGIGSDIRSNFSIAYFSAWNTTRNETFESEALRIDNYRALYHATWNITNTNTTLVYASPAENATSWSQSTANQSIIQNDWIGVQEMFSNFLGEYDWHNRAGAFEFPYPDASSVSNDDDTTGCPSDLSSCKWALDVNTVPALSAAMIWARITSLNGGERPVRNPERVVHTMYTKGVGEVVTVKRIPTLRRRGLFLVVLLVNPVLGLGCLVVKGWLRGSVVGDGFDVVSLLAAGREIGGDMFSGRAEYGNLERSVRVRFEEGVEGGRRDIRLVSLDRRRAEQSWI